MLRGSRQLVTRKSGVSPVCYDEVTRKLTTFRPSRRVANLLRGSWRRRQQVREEVTGKLVQVEFELNSSIALLLSVVRSGICTLILSAV